MSDRMNDNCVTKYNRISYEQWKRVSKTT